MRIFLGVDMLIFSPLSPLRGKCVYQWAHLKKSGAMLSISIYHHLPLGLSWLWINCEKNITMVPIFMGGFQLVMRVPQGRWMVFVRENPIDRNGWELGVLLWRRKPPYAPKRSLDRPRRKLVHWLWLAEVYLQFWVDQELVSYLVVNYPRIV